MSLGSFFLENCVCYITAHVIANRIVGCSAEKHVTVDIVSYNYCMVIFLGIA